VTYVLQTGPTTYHLPIMPPSHESISGLIHWRQSPHNPIFCQCLDPPTGEQTINTWAFWGIFCIQSTTPSIPVAECMALELNSNFLSMLALKFNICLVSRINWRPETKFFPKGNLPTVTGCWAGKGKIERGVVEQIMTPRRCLDSDWGKNSNTPVKNYNGTWLHR
jgi:hypothetical protein